eukprot:759370-Prorocentrum_minimum.AAC.1
MAATRCYLGPGSISSVLLHRLDAGYIPIEGQGSVGGSGTFLLWDCDWSTHHPAEHPRGRHSRAALEHDRHQPRGCRGGLEGV